MVKAVADIMFRLLNLELERIIAEIVDNSIDVHADNIYIKFIPDEHDLENISCAVIDDGDGYESRDKMFDSFEIELKDAKERNEEEIGNFHIGLKIAPLTIYSRVDVITKMNGDLIVASFFEPKSNGGLSFDMDDEEHLNPTYPKIYSSHDTGIPKEVHSLIDEIEEEWTTIVLCSNPYQKILGTDHKASDEIVESSKFQDNLRKFLGITFQVELDANPNISIRVDGKIVKPLDPFWISFTPNNIKESLDAVQNSTRTIDGSDSETVTKLKQMSRYGTLQGYKFASSELPGLVIQPFVIPDELVRTKFTGLLPSGFPGQTEPFKGKSSGGSKVLDSENVAGFYFYRDKRLVAFGNFYDLHITDNAANNIRIRVNYPKSMDDFHFEVSPNKQRLDHMSPQVWGEVMRALSMDCGGNEYASPFSTAAPFYNSQNTTRPAQRRGGQLFQPSAAGQYQNVLVRGGKKWIQYQKCEEDNGGCGLIHEPGEICPNAPCSICARKTDQCRPNDCAFNCSTCETIGSCKPSSCSNLCQNCHTYHPDQPCPAQSQTCVNCGEVTCEGECSQISSNKSVLTSLDDRIMLRLFRNEDEYVKELLKKTLDDLGITPSELN